MLSTTTPMTDASVPLVYCRCSDNIVLFKSAALTHATTASTAAEPTPRATMGRSQACENRGELTIRRFDELREIPG
jgi:hypothetical protein